MTILWALFNKGTRKSDTSCTRPKYTKMYIVSSRYDYTTPQELCDIVSFLKQFSKVLCFKEKGTKSGKPHVHCRIEHTLNEMSWSRKLKKELPFLFGKKKGHHWIMKSSCYTCVSTKHKDPEGQDNKYCLHTSSFLYIAKEGNLVYQKGYTQSQIEEWINIGSSIKEITKEKLHKKIIFYSKLKRHSSMLDISRGIKKYYNEIRGIPMPHESDRMLNIISDQIVYTLYPSLELSNMKRFSQKMSQRHQIF